MNTLADNRFPSREYLDSQRLPTKFLMIFHKNGNEVLREEFDSYREATDRVKSFGWQKPDNNTVFSIVCPKTP